MTTTKSYSNQSRFFSAFVAALKKQLPFAIISAIISFILIPVVYFASTMDHHLELSYSVNERFYLQYFRQGIYVGYEQSAVAAVFLAVIMLCSALFGLSYLHSKKTVDLYHSLPVTRPQLLGANFLASMTAVLGPFIAIYLGTMLLQLITLAHYGCFSIAYFQFILFDLLSMILYTAVVYLFVAVIAVNVGTVFDAFAVSAAIGFTPMVVYLICGAIWSQMTYGASFEPTAETILSLSPFTFMFTRFTGSILISTYNPVTHTITLNYGSYALLLLVSLIAAAGLFLLALVCYKRRKSELAEQTQSQGVLQTIVKMTVAFLGAAGFFAVFNNSNIVAKLFAVLFGAVLIGLIAELILSRGIKYIKKNILLLLGAGGVYCLLLLCVSFDFFGYTTYTPKFENIQSVEISYNGRFEDLSRFYELDHNTALTSPESIGIVLDMHKLAIQNQPNKDGFGYANYNSYNENPYTYVNVHLKYKLKSGRTVTRQYGDLYVPAYTSLADLEDKDDFIETRSVLFAVDEIPQYTQIFLSGNLSGNQPAKIFPSQYAGVLIDALKKDMLSETLAEIKAPSQPPLGYMHIEFGSKQPSESYYYSIPSMDIVITSEYKNTLAVLEEYNLFYAIKTDLTAVKSVDILSYRDYYSYNSHRVRALLPNNYYYSGNMYDTMPPAIPESSTISAEGVLANTTGSAEIAAIAALTRPYYFQNFDDLAYARFNYEDGSICEKLVPVDRLPEPLRTEIAAKIA